MSLFLGPIHHIMYNKIKFQEGLVDAIVRAAGEKTGNDELELKLDLSLAGVPAGSLEKIVDTTNIHGSLQSLVVIVEKRLAFIVDEAIRSDIFTIEDIKDIGRQYGQDHNLGSDLSIEEVYPAIAGKMLNGMPCDRIEEMLDSTEDSFRWRDRLDIHADYWEPYGRSSKDFYQIRTSVIEGLLGQSDISYTWNGENEFELRRK